MTKELILIEWLDSKGLTGEWEFWDDIEPLTPTTCKTVGYLIDDNEKYKTLAMTISEGQVFGRITIPTCSIVESRTLKNG